MPNQEDDEKMRRDTLDMFSMNWEAVSHFLNRFFFWRGMLANDAQVACHNSAEAFVIWLMGPPIPNHVDPRYLEQLETLMGDVRPLDRMGGASQTPHDVPRRRRKLKDV